MGWKTWALYRADDGLELTMHFDESYMKHEKKIPDQISYNPGMPDEYSENDDKIMLLIDFGSVDEEDIDE